ncbi:MAG TPA: Ada metal-binding domain-containing protein, partial [Vicinamibacterales bacterium]|nr:Ada metal-binding domain-containing protein [Vicinamibacterales bacterium]
MPDGSLEVVDNTAWQAVLQRDRLQDGKFVYVALTTGIYCRPSCPARHPHRRNALLLQSAGAAQRLGYAACRRCHPDSLAPAEKSIRVALVYIETHVDQTTTLNTLAQVSGLSPNHLHQTFLRIVGLSPKGFCDARRLVRFKERLRLGESISDACYGAGYGSSRALYEKATKNLGMTPATYQRGGDGTRIRYADIGSMLGRVLLAGTEDGACTVLLGADDKTLIRQLRAEFPHAALARERVVPRRWTAAVQHCQSEDPLL